MDGKIIFDYYYGRESSQYSFYQVPQVLIRDEYFRELSTDAKLLYSIMLNRMRLSQKKEWFDEAGKIYIQYTVLEIMGELNCCKQKALKLLSELDNEKGIGLIERVRRGQGKPDIIFVKHFARVSPSSEVGFSDFQRYENHTSSGMNNRPPEVGFSDFQRYENHTSSGVNNRLPEVDFSDSYTIYSKKEIRNTELEYQSINQSPEDSTNHLATIDRMRLDIRERIEFDNVCELFNPQLVGELVEIMVDISLSSSQEITISGGKRSMSEVKGRFALIDRNHIEYVLHCMSKNTTRINNIRGYLIAALFNAPITIESFYTAAVNHDANE